MDSVNQIAADTVSKCLAENAAIKNAVDAALATERKRCAAIVRAAERLGRVDMANALVNSDLSAEQAETKLAEAGRFGVGSDSMFTPKAG